MAGPWGAGPGIDSTAHIYTQTISNADVFLSLFFPRDFLHAAPCKGRLLFLYLSSFGWQNVDVFNCEIPFVGHYLYTSPCVSAVDVVGRADLPLSSVLGLFQFPNIEHAPEAAATESGAHRHLPG